jgi:thiamine-phosphate pyrophosphorylase
MAQRTWERWPETDIYGVTAAAFSRSRSNRDVVTQMLAAGVKVIQYREKDFSMAQKYRECLALRELTARQEACFIVNDDVHLALAVGADGVHVGQEDLPAEKVREIIGHRMLLGLSIATPEQADRAERCGIVDYIGVGPVYATATKQDAGAPTGLELLDYVVKHCRMPFVAIGGIKQSNVAEVVRHGASCVCLLTEIVGAPDIGEKIGAIRAEMARARQML